MQSFWLYLELVSCCKPPTCSLISCRTTWLIQERWLPRTARPLQKLRREKRLDWKGGDETGSQELASSQDLSWARKQLDKVAAQRLAGPAWLSEPHSWHQEPPAMLHSARSYEMQELYAPRSSCKICSFAWRKAASVFPLNCVRASSFTSHSTLAAAQMEHVQLSRSLNKV